MANVNFAYMTDADRVFFAGLGVPVLDKSQHDIAAFATPAKDIGRDLYANDEFVYFPAEGVIMTCSQLTDYALKIREANPKTCYFFGYKPLSNFSDKESRVACCMVMDLGGAGPENQYVPTDQPASRKFTQNEIRKAYTAWRERVPNGEINAYDTYSLDIQPQVNYLTIAYKKNGYSKQRDPVFDKFTSYDKQQNYSDRLLDAIESDDYSISTSLRNKLKESTSFLHGVPFVGAILDEAIDVSTDLLGSVTSIVEDTVREAAKELDPYLRPALNAIPGADYVAYGLSQLDNYADVTTGDMYNYVKLSF